MELRSVSRLDSIPLTAAYFTKEGYLRDRPIVTTCGIFEYVDEGGNSHKELRLPEDVFDPESLKSYKGKPIIFTHDAGEIDSRNVSENGIGTILSDGIRDGDNVRAEIVIHDSDVLKRGLRELSLGYSADLEETPGEWDGEHYDCIQHNIRINHLALVEEARAGHEARLNLDSKGRKGGNAEMRENSFNLDGIAGGFTPEDLAKAIDMYLAAKQTAETAEDDAESQQEDPVEVIRQNADRRDADPENVSPDEIPVMQEEIRTLLGELDKLKGAEDMKGDEEEKAPAADPGAVAQEAAEEEEENLDSEECGKDGQPIKTDSAESVWSEMYSIVQMANQLGLNNFVPKSIADGKKQIIKAVNPKLRLDGRSREYIDGAYGVAVSTAMNRKTVAANMKKVLGNDAKRFDGAQGKSDASSARGRMIARLRKEGGNN